MDDGSGFMERERPFGHSPGRNKSLTFDPDFTAFEKFFFPDGNDFLEFVDRVMAGIKGGAPVCRGDDDGDTGLADIEMPETMNHRDASNVPGLSNKYSDLF